METVTRRQAEDAPACLTLPDEERVFYLSYPELRKWLDSCLDALKRGEDVGFEQKEFFHTLKLFKQKLSGQRFPPKIQSKLRLLEWRVRVYHKILLAQAEQQLGPRLEETIKHCCGQLEKIPNAGSTKVAAEKVKLWYKLHKSDCRVIGEPDETASQMGAVVADCVRELIDQLRVQEQPRLDGAEIHFYQKVIERLYREAQAAYQARQKVSKCAWRFLPAGEECIEEFARLLSDRKRSKQDQHLDLTRLDYVRGLRPNAIYMGSDEFDGYIAFVFETKQLVVMENPLQGNAVYIFYSDWQSLSHLSKGELQRKHADQVVRVIHTGAWKQRLNKLLQS